MKSQTKRMILAAASAFLIASIVPKESFAQTQEPSSWAKEDVSEASDARFVPTQLNNQYQLAVTREQFSEMAVQLYEVLTDQKAAAPGENPFRDMNNDRVLQAYELGLVQGTSKVTFSPRLEVTREQMALMLLTH